MSQITRILTGEEFERLGNSAVANGFYRNDRRVFLPGMAWYCDWYYDPTGNREFLGKHVMITRRDAPSASFLSVHYWRDWATLRPPICVVCPDGSWWEIDRPSNNGDGWVVTGELPNLTCSPSIVVPGYHGYLRDGAFTADLEGRTQLSPPSTTQPHKHRFNDAT